MRIEIQLALKSVNWRVVPSFIIELSITHLDKGGQASFNKLLIRPVETKGTHEIKTAIFRCESAISNLSSEFLPESNNEHLFGVRHRQSFFRSYNFEILNEIFIRNFEESSNL